jgi:hypothetical protein
MQITEIDRYQKSSRREFTILMQLSSSFVHARREQAWTGCRRAFRWQYRCAGRDCSDVHTSEPRCLLQMGIAVGVDIDTRASVWLIHTQANSAVILLQF